VTWIDFVRVLPEGHGFAGFAYLSEDDHLSEDDRPDHQVNGTPHTLHMQPPIAGLMAHQILRYTAHDCQVYCTSDNPEMQPLIARFMALQIC
jgi:hypothetical protein